MKRIQSALALSFCAVAGGMAFAQDKGAATSDPLDKFVGSGACEEKVQARLSGFG